MKEIVIKNGLGVLVGILMFVGLFFPIWYVYQIAVSASQNANVAVNFLSEKVKSGELKGGQ